MTDQNETSRLVTTVFRAWRQAQINFLILRNYESLPQYTSNDIDVLVSPTQAGRAERTLLAAARQAGFRAHNRAEFATLAIYLSSRESITQVHFDLFTALKWRGFDFLDCTDFLRCKVERNSFAIPHPAHEAATNLLATMIYTGKVKEKYKQSIAAGFRAEPEISREVLSRSYGAEHAEAITRFGSEENWEQIEQRTGALRKKLVQHQWIHQPARTAQTFLQDCKRILKRWIKPPGMTVVLCGADGSGKSLLATNLVQNLSGSYSPAKGAHYHWKPPVFTAKRQAERSDASDPHGKPRRNTIISLLYFGIHWIEFFLGVFTRIRRVTFRGGLVLIDRYYYDFFVDQRRYRLRVPEAVVRAGYRLLPKPDLVVLLDAPPAVLQSRKQEVDFQETARQCAAYRNLVGALKNGLVVDAVQPSDKVAAEVTRAILDVSARTRGTGG